MDLCSDEVILMIINVPWVTRLPLILNWHAFVASLPPRTLQCKDSSLSGVAPILCLSYPPCLRSWREMSCFLSNDLTSVESWHHHLIRFQDHLDRPYSSCKPAHSTHLAQPLVSSLGTSSSPSGCLSRFGPRSPRSLSSTGNAVTGNGSPSDYLNLIFAR